MAKNKHRRLTRELIEETLALLETDEWSHREIAEQLNIARALVDSIAAGRLVPSDRPGEGEPERRRSRGHASTTPGGPIKKCPRCKRNGKMYEGRCMACAVLDYQRPQNLLPSVARETDRRERETRAAFHEFSQRVGSGE